MKKYLFTLLCCLMTTALFAQPTIVVGTEAGGTMTVPMGTDTAIFYPQGGRDIVITTNCNVCIVMMPTDGQIMTYPKAVVDSTSQDGRYHTLRPDWSKTFIAMDRIDSLYGHAPWGNLAYHEIPAPYASSYFIVDYDADSNYVDGGLRIQKNKEVGTFNMSYNVIRLNSPTTSFNIVEDEEDDDDEDEEVQFVRPYQSKTFDTAGRQIEPWFLTTWSSGMYIIRTTDATGRLVSVRKVIRL